MGRKKMCDMSPVERVNMAMKGLTWEEAEEAGVEILARCMAFHCYAAHDGEEFYKRIMKNIAERGDVWAKENAATLAIAALGNKLNTYGDN